MASPDPSAPLPERVWELKPWWCQPWSILATGIALDLGSWWLLKSAWLTGLVVLAVTLWWWLFLVLMPAQWKEFARNPAGEVAAEAGLPGFSATSVPGAPAMPDPSMSPAESASAEPDRDHER